MVDENPWFPKTHLCKEASREPLNNVIPVKKGISICGNRGSRLRGNDGLKAIIQTFPMLKAGNTGRPSRIYNGDMEKDESKGRWIFYYDGECGFCTFSVRALARADFFRAVTWTAFQDLPEPPQGLAREDLETAAYLEITDLRSASGGKSCGPRLYRGFYAFRMLTLRLPPLFPLALLLWLPGVNRLGEAAYAWVAANRYRISRRCRLKPRR